MSTKYDEAYESCLLTYAVFKILSDSPEKITLSLQIQPSQVLNLSKEISPKYLWLLSSREQVNSQDCRHHLDWILEQLYPHKAKLLQLEKQFEMKLGCLWVSRYGLGGPTISPKQFKLLSDLKLCIEFRLV